MLSLNRGIDHVHHGGCIGDTRIGGRGGGRGDLIDDGCVE
jgi:hypothetical protein